MISYTPHPTYELLGVTFQTWGTFIALAFLVSIFFARSLARARKIDPDHITDVSIWMIIASMIGGRLVYVLGNWWLFPNDPLSVFFLWEGGMSMFGGIFGAVAALWWYTHKHDLSFLKVIDVFAFVMPLGVFIGRIGCHLIGDHFGRLTSVPFGFFINGEVRHETAIYESIFGFVLLILFFWLRARKRDRSQGFYALVFLLSYSVFRFFSDFLRAEDLAVVDARFANLTLTQYFSIIIVGGFVLTFIFISRKKPYEK